MEQNEIAVFQRLIETCADPVEIARKVKLAFKRMSKDELLLIMCMLDEIRAKRDEIDAIAKVHKAEKLWACVVTNCVVGLFAHEDILIGSTIILGVLLVFSIFLSGEFICVKLFFKPDCFGRKRLSD